MRALALRTTTSAAVARRRIDRAAAGFLAIDSRLVLGVALVLQWAFVLGLALVVRHTAWIYYQGGDQLWYYTGGWLLAHGLVGQPLVGYLWTAFMAPIAAAAGPNLVSAFPPIVLVDVLVLLPVALLALYGTARLIAGRAFAYGVVALWLVLPLVGIEFTNPGYHQRFTELVLPQAYGLTAMADFPTMVAATVAAYFCARVLFLPRPELVDAAAAGVAAGAAIGIKPSTALFLAGPLLAFACTRLWRPGAAFVAALLPAVITLTVWKYRGYGYLPLVHPSAGAVRVAAGQTLVALHVPHYFNFDWNHFVTQLDLLREHFWSGRLIEWFVVAGLIGLGRRSLRALALVGGWFLAFALVKGGYSQASIEDSSLLRLMIPVFPAFTIMLASLVFLRPGATQNRVPATDSRARFSPRTRLAVVGATVVATAVVPLAAIAASSPLSGTPPRAAAVDTPILPADVDVGLAARRSGGIVRLTWRPQDPSGGPVFFHVFRSRADESGFTCSTASPAEQCKLDATDLGTTHGRTFVDRHAGNGRRQYRIGIAANWLNDPTFGDVYVLSAPDSAG